MIQYRNGDNSTIYSIVIEDREIALVAAYYKGFRISSKTKVIYRYPPRELGELLFYDTQLVRLFQIYIGTIIRISRDQLQEGNSPYFQKPRLESQEENREAEDGEDKDEGKQIYRDKAYGEGLQNSISQNIDELQEPNLQDSGRLRNVLKRAILRQLGI